MRDYKHSKIEKAQGKDLLDRIERAVKEEVRLEYLPCPPGKIPRYRMKEDVYGVDKQKLRFMIRRLKKDIDVDVVLLHVDYPDFLDLLKDEPDLLVLAEAFGDIMKMHRLKEDAARRMAVVKKRVKEIYG